MALTTLVEPETRAIGPAIPRTRSCQKQLGAGRLAKRALDVTGALVLLALAFPVLAVLAAALRLRTGGPVLFRQIRVTGPGRSAVILKLRTLSEHCDADTRWSVPEDQLPALARWLRGTHLDELPQLLNVLRGDLSLVGPRPERPYFAERFGREIPRYGDRHRMRAGLTGWAQVNGLNGDTSIAERVRFDNYYIDNWSLRLDLVILVRTMGLMARTAAQPTERPVRRTGPARAWPAPAEKGVRG
jgi:lipopolysaccharide/colanic/teichoic acid biosynthesis glycosyltransferase